MTKMRCFTLLFLLSGLLWCYTSKAAAFEKAREEEVIFSDTLLTTALSDTTQLTEILGVAVPDSVPMASNELILDRLSCLQKDIPLHFNPYVRGFVDYFTIRNRRYSRRVLSREHVYFPLFEKYLAKYNLPNELKYLAVVESALLPRAVSHAAAVGLWQFVPSAASDYKLKINAYIDERMDPEKATDAACRYLRNLHKMFGGNWELALAAYNCGPGNVRKAIRRSGGQADFWTIFPYLPKETRGYVPSLTAIIYTMNHAVDHEIIPDTLLYATVTDTILISQSLDLKKLSQQLSLAPDELPKLNPEVKKAILPESIRNYPLKVPASHKMLLAANRTPILDSCRLPTMVQPSYQNIALAKPPVSPVKNQLPADTALAADSLQKREYIVAGGDNLIRIAHRYNITVDQLRIWNNLSESDNLFPRQKLVIFTATSLTDTGNGLLASNATGSEEDIDAEDTSTVPAKLTSAHTGTRTKKTLEPVKKIHTVQPNDTLWNISKRYNDIPVEQIKKLNKLKNNEIKPGMKLVIS